GAEAKRLEEVDRAIVERCEAGGATRGRVVTGHYDRDVSAHDAARVSNWLAAKRVAWPCEPLGVVPRREAHTGVDLLVLHDLRAGREDGDRLLERPIRDDCRIVHVCGRVLLADPVSCDVARVKPAHT